MRLARIVASAIALAALPAWSASCSLAAGSLVFPPYQPLTLAGRIASRAAESTATITVSCSGTGGGSYSIALGPSASGSVVTRELVNASGGPAMAFNIFVDANYLGVWGDASGGNLLTGTIPATLPGSASHRVYGRIPAGQSGVRAGSFGAVLQMTLSYDP